MRVLLASFFCCFLQLTLSQSADVVFYNQYRSEVQKAEANFFRTVHQKDSLFEVAEFTMDSVKTLHAYFPTKKMKHPVGKLTTYYDSGKIFEEVHYNEKGSLHGKMISYLENGAVNFERSYKNGKREGMWKWYYANGQMCWYEFYKNGELNLQQQFSPKGEEYEETYEKLISPRWDPTKVPLNKFIHENTSFQLPSKMVLLIFVHSSGKVKSVQSTDLNRSHVEKIEQLLKEGPLWYPGLNRLRPMDAAVEIEIEWEE